MGLNLVFTSERRRSIATSFEDGCGVGIGVAVIRKAFVIGANNDASNAAACVQAF